MVTRIDIKASREISLDTFLSELELGFDLDDPDNLLKAASRFSELAANPNMLSDKLNEAVKAYLSQGKILAYTPQSFVLGRRRNFLVRANIWTPLKLQHAFRSHEEKVFSYRNTHDHNFSFMTIGYFGPGYETDLYDYDPSSVEGFVGEHVDLRYLGRSELGRGDIMIYRNKADVHSQLPPESLSVSLNLVPIDPALRQQDQFFFDPVSSTITSLPDIAFVHKRASIISMLGYMGNEATTDILVDLASSAECRRVRGASYEAISRLAHLPDDDKLRILSAGTSDRDGLVRQQSRSLIARSFSE